VAWNKKRVQKVGAPFKNEDCWRGTPIAAPPSDKVGNEGRTKTLRRDGRLRLDCVARAMKVLHACGGQT
jgi:hypothetical protein